MKGLTERVALLQVTAIFPNSAGPPSKGLRRDCLQCMLSVLMNLTHNNAAGTAAVVAARGLEAAACVVDSVLGPPEEEALFVRIADRCRAASCRANCLGALRMRSWSSCSCASIGHAT